MCQQDPKHVDVLVKDLGLEHGNSVQTPAVHDVTDEAQGGRQLSQRIQSHAQGTNFLSSWLREDTVGKAEVVEEMRNRTEEE